MGGWLREEWRLEPADLADEVQAVLGVPFGLEADVHVAGEIRIVMAHLLEYEQDPTRSLDHADAFVVRVQVGALSRIDVPEASIEWLQTLCKSLLERQARARPRSPAIR